MEDAEMAQTLAAVNQRLVAAETQTQNLTQALNNTQIELQNTRAQISAAPAAQSSGLPKGVKTTAPERFSGRPSSTYPTTKHFIDFAKRYSPFQKECPIWGPATGDQLLLRPVICGADVRPRGCREVALVSLARAAWAVAMQSAHARALLPALPWQLM